MFGKLSPEGYPDESWVAKLAEKLLKRVANKRRVAQRYLRQQNIPR